MLLVPVLLEALHLQECQQDLVHPDGTRVNTHMTPHQIYV